MLLKASALSFALLLLSRLLGLVRESAQAAAFGTSGMADVAVLMLTLPDWLTSVLVSGALAYVLLPEWASQTAAQRAQTQGRIARYLLAAGLAGTALLFLLQDVTVRVLANGVPPPLVPQAKQGLLWAACALPTALLAALWSTRLQYERDFGGMYAANLVVNGVLILAYWLASTLAAGTNTVHLLGLFLLLAMGLRLVWLQARLRRHALHPAENANPAKPALPRASLWLWAALAAGLPLALPFAARSFASAAGEGALATFNYAWKLVELPLVLAIQLVATLVFPAITQAMAGQALEANTTALLGLPVPAVRAIRGAFLMAWTLACAAIAALQIGAPTVVALLFGWGRMPADSLSRVASWGRIGAWSLLPQALIAVALTVLAAQGRMRSAVFAYIFAVVGLVILGFWYLGNGASLMAAIDAVLGVVAAIVVMAVHRNGQTLGVRLALLPVPAMAVPTMVLAAISWAGAHIGGAYSSPLGIAALSNCGLAAISVLAISYLASAELRCAMRR